MRNVLLALVLIMSPLMAQVPGLLRFDLSQTRVVGPARIEARLLLARPAPAGGATIGLWSGTQVTLPQTVFVPQGASEVRFNFDVHPTSVPIDVVLRAGNLETRLTVLPPPVLQGLRFDQAEAVAGQEVHGTVWLAQAAPGPVSVLLSNGQTVVVPDGQTAGSFRLTTPPSDADGPFLLTARLGAVERSAQLPLYATPRVAAVQVPRAVTAEEPAEATLRLVRPAPKGGARLAVKRNSRLKLPEAVTVEAGATAARVPFTAYAVKQPTLVDLEIGGVSTSFTLTPSPTVALRESFQLWAQMQTGLDDPAAPGQRWKLTLEGGPRFQKVSPGRYLVQGDFVGTLGADPTVHRVVLEQAYEGANQTWKLVSTRIHSVNGNLRP